MQGCLPGAAPGKAHVHQTVSPPCSVGPAPRTWAQQVTRGWPPPAARGRTPGPRTLCAPAVSRLSSRSPVSSGGRTRPPLASIFGGGAGSDSDRRRRSTWVQPPPASSPLLPPSSLSPSSLFPKSQDASDVRTGSRLAVPAEGQSPPGTPALPWVPRSRGPRDPRTRPSLLSFRQHLMWNSWPRSTCKAES